MRSHKINKHRAANAGEPRAWKWPKHGLRKAGCNAKDLKIIMDAV